MEEERMVTLVCLQSNALAEELQRMLAETGITAYLRNEYTNRIIGPMCDVGGVRIELAESDLESYCFGGVRIAIGRTGADPSRAYQPMGRQLASPAQSSFGTTVMDHYGTAPGLSRTAFHHTLSLKLKQYAQA